MLKLQEKALQSKVLHDGILIPLPSSLKPSVSECASFMLVSGSGASCLTKPSHS